MALIYKTFLRTDLILGVFVRSNPRQSTDLLKTIFDVEKYVSRHSTWRKHVSLWQYWSTAGIRNSQSADTQFMANGERPN